jgi:hypothetical protein
MFDDHRSKKVIILAHCFRCFGNERSDFPKQSSTTIGEEILHFFPVFVLTERLGFIIFDMNIDTRVDF